MLGKKILLVDDEPDVIEIIAYNLKKENYEVFTANNGDDALEIAKKVRPDLILLDVMMPGKDGIETCQEIRNTPEIKDTLVIFLSARSEEFTHLAGYEAGANDYVVKVIKPKVLISKINAMLQLSIKTVEQSRILSIGDLKINRDNFRVERENEEFILPRKEFDLLYLLASNTDKVFKREEILEKVWGNDVVVGERTIDVHIRRLREKLGAGSIETLKGIGYKLTMR